MFEAWQIVIIVILCLANAAIAAFGVYSAIYCRRSFARQLCTARLQQRRDELLQKLDAMRSGRAVDELEAESDDDIEDADGDDDIEDADDAESETVSSEIDGESAATDDAQSAFGAKLRILPVKEMTAKMRADFALTGIACDEKKFYARYTYSFGARLHGADDKVKEYYIGLMNEIAMYKGMKTRESAKQIRIYKGNNTLGAILFRGKSLCIAFALDPAVYADTKYRGKDMSDKKRFEQTPMLFKISSPRKLGYAQILLAQLAEKNMIDMSESVEAVKYDLSPMSDGELYDAGLLRIKLVREVEAKTPERSDEDHNGAAEAR